MKAWRFSPPWRGASSFLSMGFIFDRFSDKRRPRPLWLPPLARSITGNHPGNLAGMAAVPRAGIGADMVRSMGFVRSDVRGAASRTRAYMWGNPGGAHLRAKEFVRTKVRTANHGQRPRLQLDAEPFRRSNPEVGFNCFDLPADAVKRPLVHALGLEGDRVRRASPDLDPLAQLVRPPQHP